MRASFTLACLLLAGCSGDPRNTLLFAADEKRLSAADKAAIVDAMAAKFAVSDDGRRFVDPLCGDIEPNVDVVDLNGDGAFEVFVAWGNACFSGHTGRSLFLFIKDASGNYSSQLGFPALTWQALAPGINGFPDLELGGPGFCFPVWTWNGTDYTFKCNRPQDEIGCVLRGDVCAAE